MTTIIMMIVMMTMAAVTRP